MQPPSKLTTTLERGNALVVFVTAGDPTIDELPEILLALVEGGADVIEIGLPFSDPIADGPVIQASSQRALDAGIRMNDVFSCLQTLELGVPLVLMGYTNTALQIGYQEFCKRASNAGIDGVILSDMIPEESEAWHVAAHAANLDTIFLAAPTSTDERLRNVAECSSGFIYCISRTGVTGADTTTSDSISTTVDRIRRYSQLPICVGFGISSAEQVRQVCHIANGAVVGSYIVQMINEQWNYGAGRDQLVAAVTGLKASI